MKDYEDKDLAIAALTILGLASLLTFNAEGLQVVTHIVAAMAGIVTGRALTKNE